MLIKQQALPSLLARSPVTIYILFGQEHYLLDQAAIHIKSNWRHKNPETEETIISLSTAADWILLEEKLRNYSLFANTQLLDARYDKKTLEASGKHFFDNYLKQINSNCLLLLRAANLPSSQLQNLIKQDEIHALQATPLLGPAMLAWIRNELQSKAITFEPGVPELISLYTQGNMLACAQALEKLQLLLGEKQKLTVELAYEQLTDQCDYQLFELSDACLSGDATKALHLLRHARYSKEEPLLILWVLTQEIRQLTRLIELTQSNTPFNMACGQLKIWAQKMKLYQSALARVNLTFLFRLLNACKKIDANLKTTRGDQAWHGFEKIALSLCLGKPVGSFE